eukprot:1223132-Pyramimonas_sp.AAC.1
MHGVVQVKRAHRVNTVRILQRGLAEPFSALACFFKLVAYRFGMLRRHASGGERAVTRTQPD